MSPDPQFKTYLFSLSRLLTQTLNKPTSSISILLPLLLKTNLIPLPNLPPTLSPSPSPLNAIIAAFSRAGFPSLALRTLSLVHCLAFPLDSYSICSSLTAAAAASPSNNDKPGNQIHAVALKSGHLSNIFVCGALVDFYVKSGDVEDARKVFDEIPVKNAVCVNSLLNGYVERKQWADGISLVRGMQRLRLEPNELTLCGVLRICAEAAILGLGVQVHAYLVRRVQCAENDMFLLSSLVEMYGKCGLVDRARLVFDLAGWQQKGIRRDVVMWTSMLNAYSRNGMVSDVIRVFEEMLVEKTKPDELVFLVVLSACGRSGNVTKGLEFLELMGKECTLVPGPEHYGCVVDMLCKAGELDMAWKFVNKMLVEEENGGGSRLKVSVWGTILSACRHCGNVEIGKIAALKALELEPHNVGIYMELSNLYARLGMWDDIVELRSVMKEKGLKKHVGFSWLEREN